MTAILKPPMRFPFPAGMDQNQINSVVATFLTAPLPWYERLCQAFINSLPPPDNPISGVGWLNTTIRDVAFQTLLPVGIQPSDPSWSPPS